MSLNTFIPEVWGKEMLLTLRKALVADALVNRDYEGDIREAGDTVRINSIGQITISSYSKDTDIAAAQALVSAQTTLVIDQAKYYNFSISDVDKAQQQPKVMQEAMSYAAYQLADTIDQFILGLYVNAASGNILGTNGSTGLTVVAPLYNNVGGGLTIYDTLSQLAMLLTANKVPRQNRWAVIPPWCKFHLTMDPRFTSYNTPAARDIIARYGVTQDGSNTSQEPGATGGPNDAYLGMIEGMRVYESVNAPHTGGSAVNTSGSIDAIIAGNPMAWTYADSVVEVEAYRPPLRFDDAVKGLHLYGCKVTRPEALAVAYVKMP